MFRPLLLILVMLVAGCTERPQPAESPEFSVLSASMVLPGGIQGTEPMIVSGEGLVVVAPGFPRSDAPLPGPVVWVSHDNGLSFNLSNVPTYSPIGSFGEVGDMDVLLRDGVIYVATMWRSHVEVALSTDGGVSWEVAGLLRSLAHIDRPWLVPGPGPGLSLVYFQPATGTWIATLDPATALSRQRLAASNAETGCACAAGRPLVDTGGSLIIPVLGNSDRPNISVVHLVRSTDDAWDSFTVDTIRATEFPTTPARAGITSIASVHGRVVLALATNVGEGAVTTYATQSDDAVNWSPLMRITPQGRSGAYPLVLAVDDRIYVTEYTTAGAVASPSEAQGSWHATMSMLDAAGASATYVSATPSWSGPLQSELRDFLSVTSSGEWLLLAYTVHPGGHPEVAVERILPPESGR